jgi:hypothetical protein
VIGEVNLLTFSQVTYRQVMLKFEENQALAGFSSQTKGQTSSQL